MRAIKATATIIGLLAGAVALGILIGWLVMWTLPANAHSWYGFECCSGMDCAPIAATAVKATAGGWYLIETGETIPYGDRRERQSQDSDFHRCVILAGQRKGQTRCLYVPGMGS